MYSFLLNIMATHVEMNYCLTKMDSLQGKMMDLQETKKKQKAEQEEKTIKAELNMAVMENWLDIYHFNQEQKKMSDIAKRNYDEYIVSKRQRNEYGEEMRGGFEQSPMNQNFPAANAVEARRLRHERMRSSYKHISQHEQKIIDDYNKYCIITHSSYDGRELIQPRLKEFVTFHRQQYKTPDTPSQFMIDFIEATYNLFQIQQKRINELERVVAELNAKMQ